MPFVSNYLTTDMIGRGTRLCPDLFGQGKHKEFFQVFDFCQNFEFFNQNPEMAEGAASASLSARLFRARVELAAELDRATGNTATDEGEYAQPPTIVLHVGESDSKYDAEAQLRTLRESIVRRLRDEVNGMSSDNFIVRPKRRYVEKYSLDGPWSTLGPIAQSELGEQLAGLPSNVTDDDIEAKQFDLLILRTQLAVLRSEKAFDGLRQKIVQMASLLEELSNVPMVAKELALIHDLQSDEFWQDITTPILDDVRRRMRVLVKLIELKRRPIIYTDFEDEIGSGAEIQLNGIGVGTDMERFRRKARHYLKDHENHIAILKLRRNEPLTRTDLAELDRMFVSVGDLPVEIERLRSDGQLGIFVRSLIGMDREAAKKAFTNFLSDASATSNQIEFINMIVEYLTERGSMDARLLYESPFTDVDPLGIEGIFKKDQAIAIVGILDDIEKRAAA